MNLREHRDERGGACGAGGKKDRSQADPGHSGLGHHDLFRHCGGNGHERHLSHADAGICRGHLRRTVDHHGLSSGAGHNHPHLVLSQPALSDESAVSRGKSAVYFRNGAGGSRADLFPPAAGPHHPGSGHRHCLAADVQYHPCPGAGGQAGGDDGRRFADHRHGAGGGAVFGRHDRAAFRLADDFCGAAAAASGVSCVRRGVHPAAPASGKSVLSMAGLSVAGLCLRLLYLCAQRRVRRRMDQRAGAGPAGHQRAGAGGLLPPLVARGAAAAAGAGVRLRALFPFMCWPSF